MKCFGNNYFMLERRVKKKEKAKSLEIGLSYIPADVVTRAVHKRPSIFLYATRAVSVQEKSNSHVSLVP